MSKQKEAYADLEEFNAERVSWKSKLSAMSLLEICDTGKWTDIAHLIGTCFDGDCFTEFRKTYDSIMHSSDACRRQRKFKNMHCITMAENSRLREHLEINIERRGSMLTLTNSGRQRAHHAHHGDANRYIASSNVEFRHHGAILPMFS